MVKKKKPAPKPKAKKRPAAKPQAKKEQHMADSQVIGSFAHTKLVDVLVGSAEGKGGPNSQKQAKNSAGIKDGSSTMAVGNKARFDTTPVSPTGKEYPGNDPTVNGPEFKKEDGTSPIIEWRWLVDGKEASNSAQMDDPFELGSYEDNGGCTPTLKLLQAVGSGRHEVQMFPFVRPEYNGGVAVEGTPVVFFVD
jgi:hypothetical protein